MLEHLYLGEWLPTDLKWTIHLFQCKGHDLQLQTILELAVIHRDNDANMTALSAKPYEQDQWQRATLV